MKKLLLTTHARYALRMIVPLLLLSLFTHAQENIPSAKGTVKDEKGMPVAGVSVIASNSAGKTTSGTPSNATGEFYFSKLAAGNYSFAFSAVG